jgi:glutaredoxin
MWSRALGLSLALVLSVWSAVPPGPTMICRGQMAKVGAVAPACSHCAKSKAADATSKLKGECCVLSSAPSRAMATVERAKGHRTPPQVLALLPRLPHVLDAAATQASGRAASTLPPILQYRHPLLN